MLRDAPRTSLTSAVSDSSNLELRLLLEELCCDLSRFEHVSNDGLAPEHVRIDREVALGQPGAFADIKVRPRGGETYFIEVKYGCSDEAILRSLARKYAQPGEAVRHASRVVLVVDRVGRADWEGLVRAAQAALLGGSLKLEVWDEERFAAALWTHFGVELGEVAAERLIDVRQAIDHAKGFRAFGGESPQTYEHDNLKAQLLWHFGFWRLRQVREPRQLGVRDIVPPGHYRDVVVVLADLCSFSSYVRDTPNPEVIRENLTSFYSKARYQIINSGGMLYQFVGDEVIGIFGLPDHAPGYVEAAYETARALCSIGRSVAHEWQRQIDREQSAVGLHAGVALGDLHLLSLRPFSRTHLGFIGDCINVAARLMSHATVDEIIVSNSFYQRLPESARRDFCQNEPVEAKNVGRIKAWKATMD
jgi:adenylate cyclase